jgi:uncharacterized protein YbjT (DUF2867 family)
MTSDDKQTVAVAGASGFVGRALPAALGEDYRLVGLSREVDRARARVPGYRWRRADLFSRLQTREALEGAELAVYLVHSLHPSARLTQGEVGDLDLICADNFARAARRCGVEHIVYVSSIVPGAEEVSDYLASRLEVEQTLGSYGTPVTTLRAGLVIGPGGSGTDVILKLVRRLPAMVLPRWADSQLAPIARPDLVGLIDYALSHADTLEGSYDVGGPESVSFRELLEITSDLTGKTRRFGSIPVMAPVLSSAWVSLWTGQPRWVVRPLIESLRRDLIPADRRLQQAAGQQPRPVRQALSEVLEAGRAAPSVAQEPALAESAELVARAEPNEVRAVQRLTMPAGRDAHWLAGEYRRWLPGVFGLLIAVRTEPDGTMCFYLRPLPWPLLVLQHDEHASSEDRQLYWIRGGLLAARHEPGRLEFRLLLDGAFALAALHEFRPRLPWLVYVGTQARIHHLVMSAFNRHLRGLAKAGRDQLPASDDEPDRR